MPISIHGKQYVTVAERVTALHDDAEVEQSITTEIVGEDEHSITVKATVQLHYPKKQEVKRFTGHARSSKEARSIEGQSPLEVAETSAVGRALGFAGYGAVEGIASADEVVAASTTVRSNGPPPAQPAGITEAQLEFAVKLATRYTKHLGGMDAVEEAFDANTLPEAVRVALRDGDDGRLVWKLNVLTKSQAHAFIEALKAELKAEQEKSKELPMAAPPV